ncbi:MAG: carboxypeptidase-like regulatory domain-containing protein [Haliscomenobacter sp.]|nr:carboxypeptidase-like regulatory domain-containing protein [Haliscomenobacter sp.]
MQIRRDTLLFEDLSQIRFSKVDSLLPSILGQNYVPIQPVNSTSSINNTYNGRTQLIRGRILDDNGEPLIGAAVLVKGTSIGAVTDIDGYYSLPVPFDQLYRIHYQEIDYDAGRRYGSTDFTLNASASLSEVVVTGLV